MQALTFSVPAERVIKSEPLKTNDPRRARLFTLSDGTVTWRKQGRPWTRLTDKVRARMGDECACCLRAGTYGRNGDLEIGHIIPFAKTGMELDETNLAPVCKSNPACPASNRNVNNGRLDPRLEMALLLKVFLSLRDEAQDS